MRKIFLLAAVAVLSAFAVEVHQVQTSFIGRTNDVTAVATTQFDRGILYRAIVTVGGSNKTNNLVIADTDGSVIASNLFGSGTTTLSYTNNPVPFVGLIISTFGANATTVTNTVTYTYGR